MKFQEFEAKGSKEVGLWLAEKVDLQDRRDCGWETGIF